MEWFNYENFPSQLTSSSMGATAYGGHKNKNYLGLGAVKDVYKEHQYTFRYKISQI